MFPARRRGIAGRHLAPPHLGQAHPSDAPMFAPTSRTPATTTQADGSRSQA